MYKNQIEHIRGLSREELSFVFVPSANRLSNSIPGMALPVAVVPVHNGCRKYDKMTVNNVLLFYVTLIAPISIVLFLYGFFPIAHHGDAVASRSDIPNYIGNVR